MLTELKSEKNRVQKYLKQVYYQKNIPEEGITYSMEYIDTKTENKPVIVCLHGTPGSALDFKSFCHKFGSDYRIIIPQFPDFEFTKRSGHFWHSNDERTELIVSFLNLLDIEEVDCLVCHSGGNIVALQIISGEYYAKPVKIKSLVMITTPGYKWVSHEVLNNSIKICKIAAKKWKRAIYRFFLPDWLKILMGMPKTMVKNTTRDELYQMFLVIALSGFEYNIENRFKQLSEKKVPTLFVCAEKDNLISFWKFEKTLELMSANDKQLFTYIGKNGETETESTAKEWISVLDFKFGGHFCFIKYSEVFENYFQKFKQKT